MSRDRSSEDCELPVMAAHLNQWLCDNFITVLLKFIGALQVR